MVWEGLPTSPKAIFKSGDEVIVLRWAKITRGNITMRRLYMVLTEQIQWRYQIPDEELNYDFSEYGVYVREYPDAYFEELTSNPENPLWLVHCSFFDATPSTGEEADRLRARIKGLETDLSNARNEIETLREQYKSLVEYVRELEDKLGTRSGG